MSLYIVINPNDAERLTPLTRLLLQTVGNKLTSELTGKKHRLLFLIDEFPTLGKMSFFEKQLAFFAGYGIKCAVVCQSFGQLRAAYGRDTSIPDNSRFKVILGADGPEDADLIAKYLGQQTIARQTETRSGQLGAFIKGNKSVSEGEVARTLMTPDEILRMSFDKILMLVGGQYPYLAGKVMYFLDPRLKNNAKLETPEQRTELNGKKYREAHETIGLSRGSGKWEGRVVPLEDDSQRGDASETQQSEREMIHDDAGLEDQDRPTKARQTQQDDLDDDQTQDDDYDPSDPVFDDETSDISLW